jgi:hypothetical protein
MTYGWHLLAAEPVTLRLLLLVTRGQHPATTTEAKPERLARQSHIFWDRLALGPLLVCGSIVLSGQNLNWTSHDPLNRIAVSVASAAGSVSDLLRGFCGWK